MEEATQEPAEEQTAQPMDDMREAWRTLLFHELRIAAVGLVNDIAREVQWYEENLPLLNEDGHQMAALFQKLWSDMTTDCPIVDGKELLGSYHDENFIDLAEALVLWRIDNGGY